VRAFRHNDDVRLSSEVRIDAHACAEHLDRHDRRDKWFLERVSVDELLVGRLAQLGDAHRTAVSTRATPTVYPTRERALQKGRRLMSRRFVLLYTARHAACVIPYGAATLRATWQV
jgi:hypothetical protein